MSSQKRLREIVAAFSKVTWKAIGDRRKSELNQEGPKQLRLAFEQLGPSFVKIGQILSTRSDILPKAYVDELSQLQSHVLPLDSQLALEAIEKELGQPLESVFSVIYPEPLASGSVAQTHLAKLHTGQKVVVKIQRPNLAKVVTEDLELLIKLSAKLPKSFMPMVDLAQVFKELKASLLYEIDFRHEAQAILRFQKNNDSNCIASPKLYEAYTTKQLLVEEYIDGIAINHYEALLASGYDLEEIGRKLMLSFIKQVFKDGYFHGDPHPGNLLIHQGKIYFIDFGIVGDLEDSKKSALNDMLYSFTTQDSDALSRAIIELTGYDSSLNPISFNSDVQHLLDKYAKLDLGKLSITAVLEDLLALFRQHHLTIPPQITILEKASLQIEGLFSHLAPHLSLMTLAKHYFIENMGPEMLADALNTDNMLIALFYMLRSAKHMPRRLNQLLEQLLNGRFLVTHDFYGYDKRITIVKSLLNRLILALLVMTFMVTGGLLSLNAQWSGLMYAMFALALVMFIALLFSFWR
ncbi:ABC1 kinase family protein [Streptococcus sp. zg-JUN1979]|uniref:ABC1 kinase family protein n=1 Tax=Streptococcus sp. zg-JUN1979 TaxID=3391450 RepID=UPI0039A53256